MYITHTQTQIDCMPDTCKDSKINWGMYITVTSLISNGIFMLYSKCFAIFYSKINFSATVLKRPFLVVTMSLSGTKKALRSSTHWSHIVGPKITHQISLQKRFLGLLMLRSPKEKHFFFHHFCLSQMFFLDTLALPINSLHMVTDRPMILVANTVGTQPDAPAPLIIILGIVPILRLCRLSGTRLGN